jgi:gamma-glutamylputrescine oxidase
LDARAILVPLDPANCERVPDPHDWSLIMDAAAPFLPISPYLERPADLQPPLEADVDADVAIVGGGLTGLSTALALKRVGVNPVLIEREFCGFGASGRNAGHLTPTIGKDIPTLLALFGEERAGALVRFADHCVHRTEQLIDELGVDCDYLRSGNIMAVVHPKQERRLRHAAEVAAKLGAKVRFLASDEMRERGVPPSFLCGALEDAGGALHPGKLALGLRRAALQAGIRIHEQTPVVQVQEGVRSTLRTPRGAVRADRVVMASNAYTREIGRPGRRIFALYDTLFESTPLSDAQLDAIGGWPGREGVYTAHESLESYRLTAQRTIIGGSKGVRYYWGSQPGDRGGPHAGTQATIVRAFRDRFPTLNDVSIAHFWGGWIAMTLNFLPSIGPLDGTGRVLHAIGYNGHGVAQATAVGDLLADQITGRENEWTRVFPRPAPTLPPEPFLWLAARGALWFFESIDRITDRQIRGGRRDAAIRIRAPRR